MPAFSHMKGRDHIENIWLLLLEKAYAKAYGTYELSEGGNPAIALCDLTGASYTQSEHGDAETYATNIKKWLKD